MSRPSQKIQNALLILGVGTIFLGLLGYLTISLRNLLYGASDFRQHVTAGKSEAELRASEGKPIWEFSAGDETKLTDRLRAGNCEPLPTKPIEGKALVYRRSIATYLIVYLDRKGRVTSVFTSQT